jgi:hypothetical protein
VAVNAAAEWQGTWDIGDGRPMPVEMSGGTLRFVGEDALGRVRLTFRGRGDAQGTVTVTHQSRLLTTTGQGIYRSGPDRLLICLTFHDEPPPVSFRVTSTTLLVTLKPSGPRKP